MRLIFVIILSFSFLSLCYSQKGGVIFYTNPPACTLKLDTQKVVTGKHYILDTGRYELTVSRKFYLTQTFDLNIVSDSSVTFRVNLERDPVHLQYMNDLAIYRKGNFSRIVLPSLLTTALTSTYLIALKKGKYNLSELEYDVLSAKRAYELNVFPDKYDELKADFDQLKSDYSKKVDHYNIMVIGGSVIIAGSTFLLVKGIIKTLKTDKPTYDGETSRIILTPYYQVSSKTVGFNFCLNL